MVYCGKPSKGCQLCRDRKTRCDKTVPACSQCIRAKRTCPGYRNQLDLMFRIENEGVIEKARSREAEKFKTSKHPGNPIRPESNTNYHVSGRGGFVIGTMPSPDLHERALAWFFTKNRPDWTQCFDLDTMILNDGPEYQLVHESISAVGLASYSNAIHSPTLMTQARKSYIKALQLTNNAVHNPLTVKNDSTLFAVLILGMFETVTGNCEDSLLAWTTHIDGATALIKLRGMAQFQTEAGRVMFRQVIADVTASSLQCSVAVPEYLVEMRALIGEETGREHPEWSSWGLVGDIIDFTAFRAALWTADAQADDVIARALELDERFRSRMEEECPDAWRYEIVYTDEPLELIWRGSYHLYPSALILQIWTDMRSCRILLHEIIRGHLPLFTTTQSIHSAEILQQMQADILASVPRHFADSSAAKSLRNGDPNGLVLWVLYLVCVMDTTTEEVRIWVVKRLRGIAEEVGIVQSSLLAGLIEQETRGERKRCGSFHYGIKALWERK